MSRITVLRCSATGWRAPFARSEFAAILAAMLESCGYCEAALELSLVTDKDMATLNQEALGCRGPTNILAFPSSCAGQAAQDFPYTSSLFDAAALSSQESSEHALSGLEPAATVCRPASFLGSLALAPQTVQREALLYGQEEIVHYLHLLAHGLAHLLGHDHGPEMDALTRQLEAAAFPFTAPENQ